MRVNVGRLCAILDPEATRRRGASPISSARSTGSARHAAVDSARSVGSGSGRLLDSARSFASTSTKESMKDAADFEDVTLFDMLHTDRGFDAFQNWFKRALDSPASSSNFTGPLRTELGLVFPLACCQPPAIPEYAFIEIMRTFTECTDDEAFDLFDLLDYDLVGALDIKKMYFGLTLLSAVGSRQCSKFFRVHSRMLFAMLTKGCPTMNPQSPEKVAWPRVIVLLRVLGVPEHLIARLGQDFAIKQLDEINYDTFTSLMYVMLTRLDRGVDFSETTVINETERMVNVNKSRSCAIL